MIRAGKADGEGIGFQGAAVFQVYIISAVNDMLGSPEGYDAFGCERESVIATYLLARILHRYYFESMIGALSLVR